MALLAWLKIRLYIAGSGSEVTVSPPKFGKFAKVQIDIPASLATTPPLQGSGHSALVRGYREIPSKEKPLSVYNGASPLSRDDLDTPFGS